MGVADKKRDSRLAVPLLTGRATFEQTFRALPASVATILSWLDVIDDALCDLPRYAYSDLVERAHMLIHEVLNGHASVEELPGRLKNYDGTPVNTGGIPTSWLDIVDDALCELSPGAYSALVERAHSLLQDILNGHAAAEALLERATAGGNGVTEEEVFWEIEERLARIPWPAPVEPLAVDIGQVKGNSVEAKLFYQGALGQEEVSGLLPGQILPGGLRIDICPVQVAKNSPSAPALPPVRNQASFERLFREGGDRYE